METRSVDRTYAGPVRGHIVGGERWIAERLRFLRERLLLPDLSQDERRAVEAEIDVFSKERGLPIGGFRPRRGLLRRVLRR